VEMAAITNLYADPATYGQVTVPACRVKHGTGRDLLEKTTKNPSRSSPNDPGFFRLGVTLTSGSRTSLSNWPLARWGLTSASEGGGGGGGEAEGHQGESGGFRDFGEADAGVAEGNIELAVAEEDGESGERTGTDEGDREGGEVRLNGGGVGEAGEVDQEGGGKAEGGDVVKDAVVEI